ncbi:glycosyltransferase family 2 protein [Hyphomicrobium sp.]|uniref:glycosyltransferase family 2 protein n=1 Tax=Hyphomicrobium sp. TaxID=82 RepID=UPI002D7A2FF1|nr:glycosyltransferase family 2 protein [Hyphomicrobium sp.]HET6388714.1 glycosyltransferase family 2 protein [Hyphomicrobium sp.]
MSVSYLISSYNKAEYLSAVLESVAYELATTGGEVFIIDDGSKDSSWSIIKKFSETDRRISCRRQENRGIFNVTNQLIESANQKWVRIIDCDDPLIRGSTLMMTKLAEETEADYIFGSTLVYGPEPLSQAKMEIYQQHPSPSGVTILPDPIRYAIRDYNHIPSTALMRRRSIPSSLRLNEDLISCQDLALALPIFEQARVARIDVAVCHQLVNASKRLSANEALTYFQTIQIIKEFGAASFDDRYRYMSARKTVSRALRWMRHEKLIASAPQLYARLLYLYATLLVSNPARWEYYMDCAARPYAQFVPADRRVY